MLKSESMLMEKTFKIKDNPYYSEHICDFLFFHIDEKKDLLVKITFEKIA